MFLIAGLGNPGAKYQDTRHNVGFKVIDLLVKRHHLSELKSGNKSVFLKTTINNAPVILCKPLTFMNLSGESIQLLLNFYKLDPKQLVVIYDDLHLPTGQIRIRENGSSGGHNGIKSIIRHLDSDQFTRIRCGIGSSFTSGAQADYVLSPFSIEEKVFVEEMIETAADAVDHLLDQGILPTMNKFNKKTITN